MEKVLWIMSNIDMIIDLDLHRELIELESEMFQANVDCLNALDELEDIRQDIENKVNNE